MNYFDSAIQTLKNWLQTKSVKTTAKKDMPFGEGVAQMLQVALSDGAKLGFQVKNYDNYIGEVIFGEGVDKDGLAILCHLDVVPEGEISVWKVPPYKGEILNGILYGRGVADDKGAACLCLYALKELKDQGFIPNRKIKLIFGCDEESGWECIEHYLKVATMPDEGFTPDGNFPVIYAEKGLIPYKYTFNLSNNVLDVKGGTRINVVCDKAYLKLKTTTPDIISLASSFGGKFIDNQFVFEGKTAHGSTPELGDNAIKKLVKFMAEIGEFNKQDYQNLFEDRLKFSLIKDKTGNLTFSPNIINIEKGKISLLVDVRHPCTYSKEDIEKELNKIDNGEVIKYTPPLIVDENSKLVKTLMNIYNTKNNKNAKPLAIGGGTYAKALKQGVAFGICEEDMHICHMQNEGLSIEYLKKCYEIYKEAIKQLSK